MLNRTDMAKCPFTAEAAQYVKSLQLHLSDLSKEEYKPILARALSKIENALVNGRISLEWEDDEIEVLSYPTALMLLSMVGDEWAYRRYALAESKRAYELLREDSSKLSLIVATNTFKWNARLTDEKTDQGYYDHALHFKDYLGGASLLRDSKWKLANRTLEGGFVRLTKDEFCRILAESIQKRVLSRTVATTKVPSIFQPYIDRIRQLLARHRVILRDEEVPKIVTPTAFPPCMEKMYGTVSAGKNLSHIGRFALTSFLVNVGASPDDVVKIFKSFADFDERKTRYQAEHIAGMKGARRKYAPPRCETLKTHGLCVGADELCGHTRHPLSYYRRRSRIFTGRGKGSAA